MTLSVGDACREPEQPDEEPEETTSTEVEEADEPDGTTTTSTATTEPEPEPPSTTVESEESLPSPEASDEELVAALDTPCEELTGNAEELALFGYAVAREVNCSALPEGEVAYNATLLQAVECGISGVPTYRPAEAVIQTLAAGNGEIFE